MSIYSDPYPRQGVENCPNVGVAGEIISAALFIDGERHLPLLGPYVEPYPGNPGKYWVKNGVGIANMRPLIARLWEQMSNRARLEFLRDQAFESLSYLMKSYGLLQEGGSEKADLDAKTFEVLYYMLEVK